MAGGVLEIIGILALFVALCELLTRATGPRPRPETPPTGLEPVCSLAAPGPRARAAAPQGRAVISRAAELARSRAFHGLTEADCQIWFGVGIATLERIEAGEVEPSDELEERIARFLNAVGGGSISLPSPTPGPSSYNPAGPLAPAAPEPSPASFLGEKR